MRKETSEPTKGWKDRQKMGLMIKTMVAYTPISFTNIEVECRPLQRDHGEGNSPESYKVCDAIVSLKIRAHRKEYGHR